VVQRVVVGHGGDAAPALPDLYGWIHGCVHGWVKSSEGR
jgi:hypothetical protein